MNTKSILSFAAVVAALALMASPLALNSAFANHDFEFNNAEIEQNLRQSIEPNQENDQDSFIVSGDYTINSGNNFNNQDQFNFGDNVAGQDADIDQD